MVIFHSYVSHYQSRDQMISPSKQVQHPPASIHGMRIGPTTSVTAYETSVVARHQLLLTNRLASIQHGCVTEKRKSYVMFFVPNTRFL